MHRITLRSLFKRRILEIKNSNILNWTIGQKRPFTLKEKSVLWKNFFFSSIKLQNSFSFYVSEKTFGVGDFWNIMWEKLVAGH